MTNSRSTGRPRAKQSTDSLTEHAGELLILLELDEMAKKKMPFSPSEKVLDEFQQWAMDQFDAYQRRVGKVPD